jgi:hypothetical protein
MKSGALLLAIAGLCLAGGARKTFTGIIYDNRCSDANRARQCPSTRDPRYTLQSGDDAWLLSDQKTPAQYAGKKVVITGSIGPDNKLIVYSIVPSN